MKNIEIDKVREIESACKEFYDSYTEANQWVNNYLKFEEKDNLSTYIKKSRAEILKIQNSICSKPVFAIFGISQVGKSYLVQNILSLNGDSLKIKVGEREFDFLSQINPVGNQRESTGVVTRFTIDQSTGSNEFPVKAKMLVAKDVVIILADAFFSDITSRESYTSREEFKKTIENLNSIYGSNDQVQNYFTEDDIWNTFKYFGQNFKAYAQNVKDIELSGFWHAAGNLISKIPVSEWHRLFELIWCKDPEMTKLFKLLISALEQIEFNPFIYLNETALLRDEGAILDVETLNKILSHSTEYEIQLENGKRKKIEISKLSAVTAEVTLPVNERIADDKPFLANTDLLDFPGARSRESFTSEMMSEQIAVKMFLRGKVSFLFNKYSSDFEINNLLFCMKDEKIEVNVIADLLYDWITKNVGETPEKREEVVGNLPTSPLFVIFTFFNRQLSFDPVNDDKDVRYKWDNRFRKFFEEQITFKYNWHTSWTKTKPNFSNFYLLRDFKYSKDVFNSENGIEIGVKSEMQGHLNKLQSTFQEDIFVKKHFETPLLSWENSASPQKDGSQMIIDALLPAANNFVKTSYFCKTLQGYREKILTDLSKYMVNDNLNEKRKIAFQKATDIEFELLNLFQNPGFSFIEFLELMSLNEVEIYNLIHKNYVSSQNRQEPEHYQIFKKMFPLISNDNTLEENLNIIKNQLHFDTTDEVKQYLVSKNIDLQLVLENRVLTSAARLVDSVIDSWRTRLELENFESYFQMGLDKNAMYLLVENLYLTFDSLGIRDELIQLFEQKTRLINAPSDTEEYLASIITEHINDFVSNFGFNFMKEDRINEIVKIAKAFNQNLNLLTREDIQDYNAELKNIYDKTDSLNDVDLPKSENFQLFTLKIKLAMLSNCGFAMQDENMNASLTKILGRLKMLKFELN